MGNPATAEVMDLSAAQDTVRREYRPLSDDERANVDAIKSAGAAFLDLLDRLTPQPEPVEGSDPPMMVGTFNREYGIARERIEEAVMWAVKGATAP